MISDEGKGNRDVEATDSTEQIVGVLKQMEAGWSGGRWPAK